MAERRLESLPEECLSHVISFTSPRDACRSSLVSQTLHEAADSELAWENFLPSDWNQIISRSVSPVEFSSKKELYHKLSTNPPLLIDGGSKTFSIDRYTNKKCYMLSARELSIAWSSNSLFWCWKPLLHSRFPEAVELIIVSWLEIRGKINSKLLSPNTTYGAYLVFQLANRAFGLGAQPSEVAVEVGDYRTGGTVCMDRTKSQGREGSCPMRGESEERRVFRERGDGWFEVELGEFYNDGSGKVVKMEFKETKGEQLKGGLLVEGIEIKPKHSR